MTFMLTTCYQVFVNDGSKKHPICDPHRSLASVCFHVLSSWVEKYKFVIGLMFDLKKSTSTLRDANRAAVLSLLSIKDQDRFVSC